MIKLRKITERGIGTFEAAAMMVILTTLLMSGAALSDFLYQVRALNNFTADILSDTHVKPLSLNNSMSGTSIEVNSAALSQYLQDIVAQAEESIIAINGSTNPIYRIEAAYAVVSINPQTGVSEGLEQSPFSEVVTAGSLSVPQADLQRTDLGTEFQRLSQVTAGEGMLALHALPTPMLGYSQSHGGDRYINRMVIVGMRSFLSLEGTFTGQMFSMVGGNPLVSHHRANILRGNFSE